MSSSSLTKMTRLSRQFATWVVENLEAFSFVAIGVGLLAMASIIHIVQDCRWDTGVWLSLICLISGSLWRRCLVRLKQRQSAHKANIGTAGSSSQFFMVWLSLSRVSPFVDHDWSFRFTRFVGRNLRPRLSYSRIPSSALRTIKIYVRAVNGAWHDRVFSVFSELYLIYAYPPYQSWNWLLVHPVSVNGYQWHHALFQLLD